MAQSDPYPPPDNYGNPMTPLAAQATMTATPPKSPPKSKGTTVLGGAPIGAFPQLLSSGASRVGNDIGQAASGLNGWWKQNFTPKLNTSGLLHDFGIGKGGSSRPSSAQAPAGDPLQNALQQAMSGYTPGQNKVNLPALYQALQQDATFQAGIKDGKIVWGTPTSTTQQSAATYIQQNYLAKAGYTPAWEGGGSQASEVPYFSPAAIKAYGTATGNSLNSLAANMGNYIKSQNAPAGSPQATIDSYMNQEAQTAAAMGQETPAISQLSSYMQNLGPLIDTLTKYQSLLGTEYLSGQQGGTLQPGSLSYLESLIGGAVP